jgi:hypothetical protein
LNQCNRAALRSRLRKACLVDEKPGERAWFRASGFELDAGRLPSIDDVLLPKRNKS